MYQTPKALKPILKTLDIIQLSVTLLYSILYYKCKFVLASYRAKKKVDAQISEERKRKDLGMAEEEAQKKEKKKGIKYTLGEVASSVKHLITNNPISILFNNDEKFSYVVVYIASSLLGTFYDQKLFMFYILFYFMKNQTLENVFKAITFNISQLLSVGVLGLVFVYVFCLIFYETYALELMADKEPKEMCDGIIFCILDLYVSGTIGGSVQQLKFTRFITDLIYFVFFGLLF